VSVTVAKHIQKHDTSAMPVIASIFPSGLKARLSIRISPFIVYKKNIPDVIRSLK
jgi:hypothetical protein